MEDGEKEPKPFKQSLSLVIKNEETGTFLLVLRPEDPNDPNSGQWGLPAASQRLGENLLDTAARAASKLGVSVRCGAVVGDKTDEREEYEINMLDVEATIIGGLPDCSHAEDGVTQYEEIWWAPPSELVFAAERGSLCSQILLDRLGIAYEEAAA